MFNWFFQLTGINFVHRDLLTVSIPARKKELVRKLLPKGFFSDNLTVFLKHAPIDEISDLRIEITTCGPVEGMSFNFKITDGGDVYVKIHSHIGNQDQTEFKILARTVFQRDFGFSLSNDDISNCSKTVSARVKFQDVNWRFLKISEIGKVTVSSLEERHRYLEIESLYLGSEQKIVLISQKENDFLFAVAKEFTQMPLRPWKEESCLCFHEYFSSDELFRCYIPASADFPNRIKAIKR